MKSCFAFFLSKCTLCRQALEKYKERLKEYLALITVVREPESRTLKKMYNINTFRSIIFIVSFLIINLLGNATVQAQFYECTPPSPCSTVVWTTGSYTTGSVGGVASSCSATISYKYRKCGGGTVEMVITGLTFSGSGCTDLTAAEIFDRALYLTIIAKLTIIIDTTAMSDWKNWKISRPGCIKKK